MENQSLRKRLYQNLSQKPIKTTFLLQSEPKSPSAVLRPKIFQETVPEPQKSPIILLNKGKSLMSNEKSLKEPAKKKAVVKPQEVPIQKLSKEAKSILEDRKIKIKNNLKPHEIFSFYDAFPQMIEDFFYLNRLSHPYDYQIVSYAKRNPQEYMTISSQGVTLYHDKEAEFLTRKEWLEDEKIYYKLQKIDFFNQYKLSKNFSIWKSKMKLHYMKQMSSILQEKLFLTCEHPRHCLKQVRRSVLILEQSLSYLPIDHHQPLTWKEFLSLSNNYQSNGLLKKIQEIEKEIVRNLEEAIDKEIKNFKENNKIKIEGLNSKQENKEGYVYSQEAILRKQYKKVLKLIKLAEGILLESKIELIHRWMRQIIQKLKEVSENNLREEWLTLTFVALPPEKGCTTISWDPTYEQFISTFQKIIKDAVDTICGQHQSILMHPAFEKYRSCDEQLMVVKEDKYNYLKKLIQESDFYRDLQSQIQDYLNEEYKQVKKEEVQLQKFIEIYTKHKNMQKMEDILGESKAAEISLYVRQWKQENEQMQELPDRYSGMIKFDYSIMRKTIMGVAQQSLNALFNLIPLRLSDICHSTEKSAKVLLQSINIIPNDNNFVEFTKAVKNASDSLDEIITTGTEMKQILILLDDNRRPNLDIHRTNIKEAMGAISELKAKVDEANAKYDHRLSKFKKDIEANIAKIKTNIKQNTAKFEQIETEQNQNDVEQVLFKINTTFPSIEEIQTQANKIQGIQVELGLHETDFSDAHKLYQKVKEINQLWNCKKQWKELISEIQKQHYTKVDCDLMMQKYSQFTEEAEILKQKLQDNEYLKKLISELNDFENLIELIRALQSKSLDQKAWKQISEYLAYEIEKMQNNPNEYPFSNLNDPIYTVEWLIENQIDLYKEKIEFIVKKSQKESELGNSHLIMKNYLSNVSLQFVSKKRQLFVLGPNENVFTELKDHLSLLLTVFNHEYSENLKKDIKVLAKNYEYVIEILECARQFGQNWEKYEDLFESSRPYAKQLNKESKDFNNWENSWKKILKTLMVDGWAKKISEECSGSTPSRITMKSIIKANSSWESIKKGIEDFLDRRRSIFHHYYYLTDEQLLNLLRMAEHNLQITPSIVPIIYDHIEKINLEGSDVLASVISKDGQELKVGKLITCKIVSEFQETLRVCQQHWKKSLVNTVKKVFNDFVSMHDEEISRRKVISENVTQVVLAFDQIVWVKLAQETYLCPDPIGSLDNWVQIQNYQIKQLYGILKENLTIQDKKKIEQLLLQEVYFREKTEHFIETKTTSLESYEWERMIKLCDGIGSMHEKLYYKTLGAHIFYGGEFFGGNFSQLMTPETEKSHRNLIMAVHDRQVSLVSEGHQETIKDLALYTAQIFRSFSFNQNEDLKMLSRVLAGTCSQGSWAYFKAPNSHEFLSLLANQLTQIHQIIIEGSNSIQLGKYNVNLNQNLFPSFFMSHPKDIESFYTKIPHQNFRSISLIHPDTKKILISNTSTLDQNPQIGEVVWEMMDYCQKMFKDKNYLHFNLSFAMKILQELRESNRIKGKDVKKQIALSFKKIVEPRLLLNDQVLFQEFVESYDFAQVKKMRPKKTLILNPVKINEQLELFLEQKNNKYGFSIIKDANLLIDTVSEPNNMSRNIILVGESLSGKSEAIQIASQFMANSTGRTVDIRKIYPTATPICNILGKEQNQSVISKIISESSNDKWIVFDGPINHKLQEVLEGLKQKAIINNFGVFDFADEKSNVKILVEASDLSSAMPSFVFDNCLVYMQKSPNRVSEILKASIMNVYHEICEEKSRMQMKNDDSTIEIKYFTNKKKQIDLSCEMLDYLYLQLASMIEKIAPQGFAKIKSIDFIYCISSLGLVHKCCQLIESVLKMNWDTIKQKDKNNKKTFEKFALWAVFWSLSGLVASEDMEKFEKSLTETLKIQGSEQLSESVIFPGTGLELTSIRSQKAQSALPNIPGRGVPTNLLTQYWLIFESNNSIKNKFYEEIYLDQPHSIRVNTQESTLFSYISYICSFNRTPVAICGPAGSGKKSIIELFNKNNQQKFESFSLRAKWNDPYFVSTQIHIPFSKLSCGKKNCFKPTDISKEIHISIEDVSLSPHSEPTSEFIRMFLNEHGFWNNKSQWTTFRQYILSLIISQIQAQNIERITFNRTLSRIFLLQTGKVTKDKLISIYGPIVETWGSSTWEDPDCEDARVFTSRNGDSLIDATANIFQKASEIARSYDCLTYQNRNKGIIFTPKIQDICGVIINIFQTQDACNMSAQTFSELWGHEMLRVFCDKLSSQNDREEIIKQIKKESLLKFKNNFIISSPHFIYSQMGNEEGAYTKCQSINQIYQYLEEKTFHGTLPILFDEMVEELVKFYRILNIQSGHALIVSPYINSTRQLWKIVCFIQETVFHQIEDGCISFETHIFPTVLNEANTCLFLNSQQIQNESLYLISCLLNRNNYYFDICQESSERIKNKLTKIAQETISRELESAQGGNSKAKAYSIGDNSLFSQQSGRLLEMTTKIDHYLHKLISEEFSQHAHYVLSLHPGKSSSTMFLHNNMSIMKHLQVIWHQFEDSTIHSVSENMIKDNFAKQYPEKRFSYQGFDVKCQKIYEVLSEQLKKKSDLLKLLSSSAKLFYVLDDRLQEQLSETQQCLKKLNNNKEFLQKCKEKGENLQSQLQQLVKKQDSLNHELKSIMEREENTSEIQSHMREIKHDKEILQQNSRQVRTSQKIYQDLLQLFPTEQNLKQSIEQKEKQIKDAVENSILAQASLLFLNSVNQEEYLMWVNKWRQVFGKQPQDTIEEVLSFFEGVCGKECIKIPQWHNFSSFTQLKGVHFLYNCLSLSEDSSDSAFCNEFIVINDKHKVLKSLLELIPEKGSIYSDFRLMCCLPKRSNDKNDKEREHEKEKQKKEKVSKISLRNEIYGQMEREIQRSKTGVILLDKTQIPWFSRSDLDTFTKILKQRKIQVNHRIILSGGSDPVFQIQDCLQNLKKKMIQKSLIMQFGESTLLEKRKALNNSRQIELKEDQNSQEIIKSCLIEGQQKAMESLGKIKSEINEISKIKNRVKNMLEQARMTPSDNFLIQWIISFLPRNLNTEVCRKTIEIYQCLKKYLMEINCSLEQKIQKIEQIEEETRNQWQCLIRANILDGQGLDLKDLVKFLMPLNGCQNLVFMNRVYCMEEILKQELNNSVYCLNFVNLQAIKSGNGNVNNENLLQSDMSLKKLYIFTEYHPSQKQTLLDMLAKYRDNSAPVFLVLTDIGKAEVLSDEDLNREYRVLYKQTQVFTVDLLCQIKHLSSNEFSLQNKSMKSFRKQAPEEEKKQHDLKGKQSDEVEGVSQLLNKLLVILMGKQAQKGYPHLPFRFLQKKSQIVNKKCQLSAWIDDFIVESSEEIKEMQRCLENSQDPKKSEQIHELYSNFTMLLKQYSIKMQGKEQSQGQSYCGIDYQYCSDPTQNMVYSLIESLPYSFNVSEFSQTTESMSLSMISKANQFNENRAFLKKYLQEVAKILTGHKTHEYTENKEFGFWLPIENSIKELCREQKSLRKSLQFLGIITGIESSSNNIRISSSTTSPHQALSVGLIGTFSLQALHPFMVNSKFLLMVCIRACKKLKIPLKDLKVQWRIYELDEMIDESITPQLTCLFSVMSKDKKKKIMMIPYDPSIPTENAPQMLKNNASKKEKIKRMKLDLAKPLSYDQDPSRSKISIQLPSGETVGVTYLKAKSLQGEQDIQKHRSLIII